MTRGLLVAVLVAAGLIVTPAAVAVGSPASTVASTRPATAPTRSAVASTSPAVAVGAAAVTQTPAQAVAAGAAHAAATGTTAYISVRSRSTGAVLAQTGNADAQVGSESIYKLFLASYYLYLYGGYANTPSSVTAQLSYMIRYSDDATANQLYTDNAIPTMVSRYGLTETSNSTDRSGHWGASRITAHDMSQFLYDAAKDPQVGPWLLPVMAQVAPNGSDGFDQHFGMNALGGTHGSKQGWGCDSYFTAQTCAIHSVGYTDNYFVAVLQLSDSARYPDPMRSNATYAATLIQASGTLPPPPPPVTLSFADGAFVTDPRTGAVYRMAGGAPIIVTKWANVGGQRPAPAASAAQFAALPRYPRDGTFIQTGPYTYRFAGGAPLFVSSWAWFGGAQRVVIIDPEAVNHAGQGGYYSHVALRPADGTFIQTGPYTYRFAGGAPLFVTSWAWFGGPQRVVIIDPEAVNHAGQGSYWSHVGLRPADGTFIQTGPYTYVVAGGAPLFISAWSAVGGAHPVVLIDPNAVNLAGGGVYSHLSFRPANGTFVQGGSRTYRIAGGAPLFVDSWSPYGTAQPVTIVDPAAIDSAGIGGVYTHLYFRPTTNQGLLGLPSRTSYVVSGGVARRGGGIYAVGINQSTIDRAGTGGQWDHLAAP